MLTGAGFLVNLLGLGTSLRRITKEIENKSIGITRTDILNLWLEFQDFLNDL